MNMYSCYEQSPTDKVANMEARETPLAPLAVLGLGGTSVRRPQVANVV